MVRFNMNQTCSNSLLQTGNSCQGESSLKGILPNHRYYKDDSCWSADLKSMATEDIISIGNFMEVLVLNHYVLVKKILSSLCNESMHRREIHLDVAGTSRFNPSVTDRTVQGVQLDTFTAKVPSSRKTITERPPNENVDLFRNDITSPSGRTLTLFRQESTVDKMTGATDRERMPTYCPSPGVFEIITFPVESKGRRNKLHELSSYPINLGMDMKDELSILVDRTISAPQEIAL
nr:hypothetical protein [Tanacetum cinerariifolium]